MLWTRLKTAGGIGPQPSFISSSINRAATSTSVVVTAPASIQDNDLLVCVFYAATVAATTLPSGFSSVYTETSANPRINVGWKVAASESGNYTFTTASSSNLTAAILVYRNAAFDTVGSINRGTSTATATANSIDPTDAGILIAVFTASIISQSVNTAPSGMTLRANTTGSVSAPSVYVYDEVISVSSPTSNKTLIWSASASSVSGIQLSVS